MLPALLLAALTAQPAGAQESPQAAPVAPGSAAEATALEDPAVTRGRYVFQAAGCLGCHTDSKGGGAPLAGGRALATPFGTFYSPNITPDPATGIGAWRPADLARALRHGESPDGDPYYPAFPYPSYAGMTDQDIADLYAYLMAQPPVVRENRAHDLGFPYNLRFTLGLWQALYHDAAAFTPDPAQGAAWNRGAYLVRHLGHCGECHSPRGFLGAVDAEQELAGNPAGPEGGKVPNLTPGPGGLGDWSESDIAYALKTGITPDGDFLGESMGEVIENSTGKLTDADLAAIASYLKSLPPLATP
ncbi:MAG: c-type cytochrome [Kiloniellaceae bacterium]